MVNYNFLLYHAHLLLGKQTKSKSSVPDTVVVVFFVLNDPVDYWVKAAGKRLSSKKERAYKVLFLTRSYAVARIETGLDSYN